MANNIKGITIELGGNAENLNSALKDVNKAAGNAQSGLKEVNKQLKFDPKNVVLSGQKVDLLKDKVAALEDKQKTLKAAVNQAHEAFDKGDLGKDKVQAVEREYEKCNSQLKDSKKALIEAEAANGSFTAKVKSKFSDLKGKIKDTFSAENIKAGLGAAGVAVSGFLKSSLDEAKDAQKADADLEQTLKSTKGAAGMTKQSLDGLSESLSKNTTFSKDEVKSGESMLLTFTSIGKDVFPQATAAVLDFAQKMGKNPKEAAQTLGKALNDPANGISKLTKLGVTFTDKQKNQIKAMQKTGKTASAQKLIIDALNQKYGGQAAAAADTYSGKQKQISNDMKEVKETIGTALMPMIAKLLKAVTPIIQSIADFVSKNPQLTAAILAVIAVVGTLMGGLSLLTTVTGAFGITLDAAILPTIGLVVLAIAGVATAAILIVKNWGSISKFFEGVWNGIKGAFSGVGNWFKNTFEGAKNAVQGVWNNAGSWFSGIGNNIKNAFNTTINFIKNNWKQLALFLVNPIAGAAALLYKNNPKFKAWADSAIKVIKGVFSGIGKWFQSIFAGAVTGIKAAWTGITGFFGGIWNGIKNVFSAVGGWFSRTFGAAASGIQSAWSGITGFFSGVWSGITGVFNAVGSWFGNVFDSAKQAICNTFSPSALSDHFNDVWKAVQNTFSKLNPMQWGKDLIDGIANGIKSAAQHVKDAVGGVAQNIRSFLHFSVPDEGPLTDYESWMPDFMAGLADGIRNSTAPVVSAAKGVASGIAESIKIPNTVVSGLQLRTALATAGGSSVSTVNQPESKKVTQNFYGDIRAAGTGEKNSTLQQLQFISEV